MSQRCKENLAAKVLHDLRPMAVYMELHDNQLPIIHERLQDYCHWVMQSDSYQPTGDFQWTSTHEFLIILSMFMLPVLHGKFSIGNTVLCTQYIVAEFMMNFGVKADPDVIKHQFDESLKYLSKNIEFLAVCRDNKSEYDKSKELLSFTSIKEFNDYWIEHFRAKGCFNKIPQFLEQALINLYFIKDKFKHRDVGKLRYINTSLPAVSNPSESPLQRYGPLWANYNFQLNFTTFPDFKLVINGMSTNGIQERYFKCFYHVRNIYMTCHKIVGASQDILISDATSLDKDEVIISGSIENIFISALVTDTSSRFGVTIFVWNQGDMNYWCDELSGISPIHCIKSAKKDLDEIVADLNDSDTCRTVFITSDLFFAKNYQVFRELYARVNIKRVVFDTVSPGGSNHYPSFKNKCQDFIAQRSEFENVRITLNMLYLTAPEREFLQKCLYDCRFDQRNLLTDSYTSPRDVFLQKVKKSSEFSDFAQHVQQICANSGKGLVLCFTIKESMAIAQELNKRGISAIAFQTPKGTYDCDKVDNPFYNEGNVYGNRPLYQKRRMHAWEKGLVQVMCSTCTKFFEEMDLKISFIIFNKISISLETFYFDMHNMLNGKVGDHTVKSYTFYRSGDRNWVGDKLDLGGLRKLDEVVEFWEADNRCRWRYLLDYFCVPVDWDSCRTNCDVCVSKSQMAPLTPPRSFNHSQSGKACVSVPSLSINQSNYNPYDPSTNVEPIIISAVRDADGVHQLVLIRHLLGDAECPSLPFGLYGLYKSNGFLFLTEWIELLIKNGKLRRSQVDGKKKLYLAK